MLLLRAHRRGEVTFAREDGDCHGNFIMEKLNMKDIITQQVYTLRLIY